MGQPEEHSVIVASDCSKKILVSQSNTQLFIGQQEQQKDFGTVRVTSQLFWLEKAKGRFWNSPLFCPVWVYKQVVRRVLPTVRQGTDYL